MEIKGKIIRKMALQSGVSKTSGKEWKMQGYVLQTAGQYPQNIYFTFFGDKITEFPLNIGDNAIVDVDVESRPFTGRDGIERWSTEVHAWKAVLDVEIQEIM